jgi:hypothetical protein
LSLFLRLDLNAGEAAHLAHLTTDLLYASKKKIQTRRSRETARGRTSVSR